MDRVEARVPASSVKLDDAPSHVQAETRTFQPTSRSTFDAIRAALVELEQRAYAVAVDDDNVDLDDLPDVVIATGVTPELLDQIPDEWLADIAVELRPNGELVALAVGTGSPVHVLGEVLGQVGAYAAANNLVMCTFSEPMLPGAGVAMPTIEVATRLADGSVGPTALVVAVDVSERSSTDIVAVVSEWFTLHPDVQRVLYIKYFAPRHRGNLMGAPALAIELCPGQVMRHDGRDVAAVRIGQTRSFGNTGVSLKMLASFLATNAAFEADPHPLLENPFLAPPNHLLRASPSFPTPLNRASMPGGIRGVLAQAKAAADNVPLRITMPGKLPAFDVDLLLLFWCALRGFIIDTMDAYPRTRHAAHNVAGNAQGDTNTNADEEKVDADADTDDKAGDDVNALDGVWVAA